MMNDAVLFIKGRITGRQSQNHDKLTGRHQGNRRAMRSAASCDNNQFIETKNSVLILAALITDHFHD